MYFVPGYFLPDFSLCWNQKIPKAIQRVAVIDCDVHQGNGTAAIFGRSARQTPHHVAPHPSEPDESQLHPFPPSRTGIMYTLETLAGYQRDIPRAGDAVSISVRPEPVTAFPTGSRPRAW